MSRENVVGDREAGKETVWAQFFQVISGKSPLQLGLHLNKNKYSLLSEGYRRHISTRLKKDLIGPRIWKNRGCKGFTGNLLVFVVPFVTSLALKDLFKLAGCRLGVTVGGPLVLTTVPNPPPTIKQHPQLFRFVVNDLKRDIPFISFLPATVGIFTNFGITFTLEPGLHSRQTGKRVTCKQPCAYAYRTRKQPCTCAYRTC